MTTFDSKNEFDASEQAVHSDLEKTASTLDAEADFDKLFREAFNTLQPPAALKQRILEQMPNHTQMLTSELEALVDENEQAKHNNRIHSKIFRTSSDFKTSRFLIISVCVIIVASISFWFLI
jgi:hypothetical protein